MNENNTIISQNDVKIKYVFEDKEENINVKVVIEEEVFEFLMIFY